MRPGSRTGATPGNPLPDPDPVPGPDLDVDRRPRPDPEPDQAGEPEPPRPARPAGAGVLARFARAVAAGPSARTGGAATPAKPSQIQRPEDRYGYAVAAFLVAVGVVFALVHGTPAAVHGAHGSTTTHPVQTNSLFPALGAAVAAGLVVAIRLGNRFAAAIVAVVASLLVETSTPPANLRVLFYLTLFIPLGWAFWLTRRQSKAARAAAAAQPRLTPEQRRADRERRKAVKRGEDVPALARAVSQSRRYTPPQPGPPKRTRKELAAEVGANARAGRRPARTEAKTKADKARHGGGPAKTNPAPPTANESR
ncbi:MAG: hypothetical protein ACRDY0_08725 [Acidimicrobiales bacterium]